MVSGIPVPQFSIHMGMGSIVFSGGVAFRVWAPFASQVQVAFYFETWEKLRGLYMLALMAMHLSELSTVNLTMNQETMMHWPAKSILQILNLGFQKNVQLLEQL